MDQSITDVGNTLFGNGIDGAACAFGKYIELEMAKAIAAGEQVLASALTNIERSAI
jgi:hypothetical protein